MSRLLLLVLWTPVVLPSPVLVIPPLALSGPELGGVMSAVAEAGAAAPSRAAELEAQVAELTQKLERETYRSAQLAAQVKEKTRKHGELV